MADNESAEDRSEKRLENLVGFCVVLLATFMGICNVKAGNIGQKMQKLEVERNDLWAWYQARNIRIAVYEATADELSVPVGNETPASQTVREATAKKYRDNAARQEKEKGEQKAAAESAKEELEELGKKDDQFDLCEASLAIALALMGVTVLLKRKWMFVFALLPATFGVFMGIAGFIGMDTNVGPIKWMLTILG